ncbi:MAG: type II toxin-antitoxin system Phd/YefM family antitoxin [Solobacterium sp.]|nr:type II toxin-antitoxin system Phd/YefM family antitoxin [Solobacterium sp.]
MRFRCGKRAFGKKTKKSVTDNERQILIYQLYNDVYFDSALFLHNNKTEQNTEEALIIAYTSDVLNSLVPITKFNRGQASRIFDRLNSESQLIVLKNNQPAAVILSPAEFSRLSEIEEDYGLLLKAIERLTNNTASATSMEDMMKELGISDEELTSSADVVIE